METQAKSTSASTDYSARVHNMLACLFGDRINVRAVELPASDPCLQHLAAYINTSDKEVAYILCDRGFAVASGAALTRVSMHVALNALKDGSLPDVVYDNFKEVLNVCVGFFTDATSSRLRLGRVEEVLQGGKGGKGGEDLQCKTHECVFSCGVEISGYPNGVLQFRWDGGV